ncbi:MAG TPA: peptidylprolyl isomerase [Opitutaceae bacterium]|nr:peptidylprolyl isomerase [Opitutaceae bacterium]
MKLVRGLLLLGGFSSLLFNPGRAGEGVLPDGLYAEIATPRGNVVCELFFQQAPLTVASFVGLAEGTLGPSPRRPFFDGVTFHRVAPGFVVQGGDPLGTGEGGPGYKFPDEFVPGLRHDAAGILSMANSGPDTNGSQFFLTLAPVNRLNYLHSVFGRTVAGLEVLPLIKQGDAMTVKILRRGAAAANFRTDEKTFAALVAAAPRALPPAFEDVSGLLPTEPPRARAIHAKLTNFTRFTGVPFYGRLYEKFEPEHRGQTPAQFTEALGTSLHLGSKGALVVWFVAENSWHLFAPGRPDLKLPTPAPWPALAATPAPTAEQRTADSKRRLLSALNEVIDGVIFQLEQRPPDGTKRTASATRTAALQPAPSCNKT